MCFVHVLHSANEAADLLAKGRRWAVISVWMVFLLLRIVSLMLVAFNKIYYHSRKKIIMKGMYRKRVGTYF